MNLFTRNSPYYHLLKYLLFFLKQSVYLWLCHHNALPRTSSEFNIHAGLRTKLLVSKRWGHSTYAKCKWNFARFFADNIWQDVGVFERMCERPTSHFLITETKVHLCISRNTEEHIHCVPSNAKSEAVRCWAWLTFKTLVFVLWYQCLYMPNRPRFKKCLS
jgi:hypothetical protein